MPRALHPRWLPKIWNSPLKCYGNVFLKNDEIKQIFFNPYPAADVAGQLHHYALGPRCDLLGRAPYDQFLTNDYGALMRDLQHNVVDAETQLAPHLAPGAVLLGAAWLGPQGARQRRLPTRPWGR